MQQSRFRSIAIIGMLALAGCAASAPRDGAEATPCVGGRNLLVVQNNYPGEVEIVESRTGSGARPVIALVTPGRHEIEIRNEPGYSYVARPVGEATVLAATSRPRNRERAVLLSRECRT